MKLLMLNWRDLRNPKSGGAEVLTEGILKELARQGWDITLFASAFPGCKREETVDGYKVIRRGKFWTVHMWAFYYWLTRFRRQKFDAAIDQIHGLPFFTPFYVRGAKVYGFIHEVASEIWFAMYPFPLSWVGYWLERLCFRFYKRATFITVSSSTKQDLILSGIPQKNIHVIPEAINHPKTSDLPPKEPFPVIIYVGRLAPMKRVEELIKAANLACKDVPELRLWVVGGGDESYADSLKRLAFDLKVEATFFGKVPESCKYSLLGRAWLLVSASLKEGFGLVTVEAATQGTPSVVYRVKGFTDAVVDGQTGILCRNNTAENLAENVKKLVLDRNLRESLSKNALSYSRKFTFENATFYFRKAISDES